MKNNRKKFSFKLPSAFTILFFIIIFIVLLSWIPGVAKTSPAGILDIFWAPLISFTNNKRSQIIIFVLILGAYINIVMQTKALDAMISKITNKLKNKEFWLIPPLMLLFSIFGTTFGIAEETLGFYSLIIPIVIAAGFDSFTGMLIILVGSGIGVLGSTINPFSIGVAVSSAGLGNFLSTTKGIIWRLVIWIVFTIIAIIFVMHYAFRVKKNMNNSYVSDLHQMHLLSFSKANCESKLSVRKIITLIIFMLSFLIMIFYLISWRDFKINIFSHWGSMINKNAPYLTAFIAGFGDGGLVEIASFFLISLLLVAVINWKGEENFINDFIFGTKDILSVCLIIAFSGGIGEVLERTGMQETLVIKIKNLITKVDNWLVPTILYLFFIPLSFLIPSTSGFATAVFGILGPVLGNSTSGAITAFSLASGIVNLVTPTSAVVIGALQLSQIPYSRLWKGLWFFLFIIFLLSILFLIGGGLIGGSIF